ncbi:MAG: hypothetical protein ACK54P_08040, partial [Bacteroidota bacterium]
MAEDLAVEHHCRRDALVTHAERIGFVVLASVVHFVAYVMNEGAVLTLCVLRVTFLALFALFDNPVVKAFMLEHGLICLDAVRAFASRRMLAE